MKFKILLKHFFKIFTNIDQINLNLAFLFHVIPLVWWSFSSFWRCDAFPWKKNPMISKILARWIFVENLLYRNLVFVWFFDLKKLIYMWFIWLESYFNTFKNLYIFLYSCCNCHTNKSTLGGTKWRFIIFLKILISCIFGVF
jgi:hypothetical protein